MKQLVTIFRAEGKMAAHLKRLIRSTPPDLLPDLRDQLREQALTTASLTAYVEFVDAWSMGDDFERAIGPGTIVRYVPMGVVYCRSVTALMRAHLQRQARTFLSKTIANFAATQMLPKGPVLIGVFRQILAESTTDAEYENGSNALLADSRALRESEQC